MTIADCLASTNKACHRVACQPGWARAGWKAGLVSEAHHSWLLCQSEMFAQERLLLLSFPTRLFSSVLSRVVLSDGSTG